MIPRRAANLKVDLIGSLLLVSFLSYMNRAMASLRNQFDMMYV